MKSGKVFESMDGGPLVLKEQPKLRRVVDSAKGGSRPVLPKVDIMSRVTIKIIRMVVI